MQIVVKEALLMPIVCHLNRVLTRVVKDLTSWVVARMPLPV